VGSNSSGLLRFPRTFDMLLDVFVDGSW